MATQQPAQTTSLQDEIKKLEQLAPKRKQVNQDNQEQIKIDNRYKI